MASLRVALEAVDERGDGGRRKLLQKRLLKRVRPVRGREVVEDAVLDVDVVRRNDLQTRRTSLSSTHFCNMSYEQ